MATVRKCRISGCEEKHYGRGLCSRHYWSEKTAGRLESVDDAVVIPPPPRPPVDSKRCRAKMLDGSRCIRGIRAHGLCGAHWREENDRHEMELREKPLDSTRHDYVGDEASLIAALEQKS